MVIFKCDYCGKKQEVKKENMEICIDNNICYLIVCICENCNGREEIQERNK